jgi:hypothetical protein
MIVKAVDRAYRVMHERGYNRVYWAIDLHGVCLHSNYETGGYAWINEDAPRVLKLISDRPESVIILWSSVHDREKSDIMQFFGKHGIAVHGINANPYEGNDVVCVEEKFYFSILLDDKAGFDPKTDWKSIEDYLKWV